MGCYACKMYTSSSTPAESEDPESSSIRENNSLLDSNGYGVSRLSESPSPERKPADGEGTYAAMSTTDPNIISSLSSSLTRTPPRQRHDLIHSQELRSSQDSSASVRSRHTEPQVTHHSPFANVRQAGRSDWPPNGQQHPPNNPPTHFPTQGPASTGPQQPPSVRQLNQQNTLQLGGVVAADMATFRPQQQSSNIYAIGLDCVKTKRGKEVMEELKKGYRWKEKFDHPSQEFLALMDRLYMECQLHLTALASRGDVESKREADAIVSEMVALRNYWGPGLLPNSTCNAFVRERIPLTLGVEQRQFRIDCAQFFEPVPFYGNQQTSCPGELMKLYRFSVYNVARNEVVLRYYLERSNVIQMYHVLCFTCENYRGQVKPYGTEPPSYWEVRQNMLEDVYSRLLSAMSPDRTPPPKPQASTVFPTNTVGRPALIQVPPLARNT